MKTFQRMGGKMMKRSADHQDVGAVIAEFNATEDMLQRLIKDLTAWRKGWEDILQLQQDASEAFAALYKSIEPASDPEMSHVPVQTPREQMQKCLALQKLYSDLKGDLSQEIGMITNKIIRPVNDAKASTRGLQKTLKHRENTKLDYERYLSRAEHARNKQQRSAKEEAALAKHETDLQQARIDYQIADDQVKQTFPLITEAVQALLPYILTTQIRTQTTLVGQLYTSLDTWSKQNGLPSPSASEGEITSTWDQQFTGLRLELESGLAMLADGKAIKMSMSIPDSDQGSTLTGLGIRNKTYGMVNRAKSNQAISSRPTPPAVPGAPNSDSNAGELRIGAAQPRYDEEEAPPQKPPRPGGSASAGASPLPRFPSSSLPSPGSIAALGNKPHAGSYTNNGSYDHNSAQAPPAYTPSAASTPSAHYATPTNGLSRVPSANQAGADNFPGTPGLDRKKSAPSPASSVTSIAAGKKKPPPPVPAKRIGSTQGTFVIALYDFDGQTPEDLPFREGDRIKVIKKTDSTDDWWEGEVNGRRGAFPANYVQL